MKEIIVICPECGNTIKYKNWIVWILKCPFHWFGKRRIKCKNCGARTYAARVYGKYKEVKVITFNSQEDTKENV